MRQSDYTKHRALSRHESYVKQKAKWRDGKDGIWCSTTDKTEIPSCI